MFAIRSVPMKGWKRSIRSFQTGIADYRVQRLAFNSL